MSQVDVVVVGAGPNGIACAVHLTRAGVAVVLLERGRLVESFHHYPTEMRFSSSRDKMEIPGHPFRQPSTVAADPRIGAWPPESNPDRAEAIAYYQQVVDEADIDIRTRRRVVAIDRLLSERQTPPGRQFCVVAEAASEEGGRIEHYHADAVIIATGSYDRPTLLGVAGEHLPHVYHYFYRGSDFAGQEVVIVGGTSSALEAAVACYWAGARVRLIHRREGLYASPTFKSCPRDAVAELVQHGGIRAIVGGRLREIVPGAVVVDPVSADERTVRIPPMNTSQAVPDPTGPIGAVAPDPTIIRLGPPIERSLRFPADAVLLMTGYRPDRSLLHACHIHIDPRNGEPQWDRATCETNIPGIYIVGAAGNPEGTGNRVGITSGIPQAARATAAVIASLASRRHALPLP